MTQDLVHHSTDIQSEIRKVPKRTRDTRLKKLTKPVKPQSGNTRFTDEAYLPWVYRDRFLYCTDILVPEVFRFLRELVPIYRTVINNYPYTSNLTEWLSGEYRVDPDSVADTHRRLVLDYYLTVKDRYKITDLSELPAAEEIAWKNCLELRNGYEAILIGFGLTSDWLRRHLFQVVRLLAEGGPNSHSLCFGFSHAWIPLQGEAIDLHLEGWKVGERWQDFETRVQEKLDSALAEHKSVTIDYWRRNGYKQMTKPLDLSWVQWLVCWTVLRMSKEDILDRIDVRNELKQKTYDIKTLEYHFRILHKKYDLPIR